MESRRDFSMIRLFYIVLMIATCITLSCNRPDDSKGALVEKGNTSAIATNDNTNKNHMYFNSIEQDGIEHISDNHIRVAEECFLPYIDFGLHDSFGRFVPAYEEGRPIGMKILLREDGILSALGFRTGDVIRSIMGVNLDSAERTLMLVDKPRGNTPDNISVDIIRDVNNVRLVIDIMRIHSKCKMYHNAKGL